ncbi:ATP-binding cassette domain-containing protein [Citrobacter sedlakii]|uniref:ATP-binding cassette domain-containing protein n=1 Tax=Citrobacter sedlakii TaxID=67826 RepID=UPI00388D65F9
MIHADIPANEPISAEALANWARAMSHIAAHYRIACSPGALQASAPWFKDKAMPQALTQLARQAGLSFQPLTPTGQSLSRWRLPVVIQLQDGELVLVEQFDGDNQLDVCFVNGDLQRNRLALSELLPTIRFIIALRPLSAVKDSRVDAYVSRFRPDWLKSLVLKDLRPYGPVMLAALLINILSLSGIVFSMQVYDRVIPAQSWPSLYVLAVGVLIAMLFGFLLRLARGHVMDLLGKRADMRVSDRVFSHALRLRNSAIPRSTGSFISQLRELEQIREMVTSSTLSTIVDLPFFFLFIVVLAIIAPPLAWIAPMGNLCGVLARWQQVKAAKKGLDSIMELPTETQRDETLVHQEIFHGHYLFENAQFRYHSEDQRVPLRINRLEIAAGERIAVLGRNGAGKSTLLQALAGGVDLVEGDARLDNISLPHIDMSDLRRNVGLLSQNARLFFGTLRENLTLGAPHASDDEIFSALAICGAANFVKRLPKGLDHPIMEGGTGLSGGQRQSILLARMLLRSPNIVLLDEPTASLDEHAEREFIQRLGQWLVNRTLVVATHRVPVLELVERVIVLKEGQLVMDAPKAQALGQSRMAAQANAREWKNENQSA